MTTEFKLPELGENVQAGDVINVLVAVGDTVAPDQPVLEIETDKATVEVPSSVSGVVKAIHVKAGDTIKVGQLILTVEEDEGAPADQPARQPTLAPQPEPEPPQEEPQPATPTELPTSEPLATPSPRPATTAPVISEFKLPELGENVQSGTVVNVLVAE
jgi:pyruvate/2-oxoglutarate dehydrogenase complex dihydrolipoamide acyltransferase (E2) component